MAELLPSEHDGAVGISFSWLTHNPPPPVWQKNTIFCIVRTHEKIDPKWPQMGPGSFFPTNPDLADILGRTNFDPDNFYFLGFFGLQISGFPGPQISKLPDFQVPRFPDAAGAGAAGATGTGRTLRS